MRYEEAMFIFTESFKAFLVNRKLLAFLWMLLFYAVQIQTFFIQTRSLSHGSHFFQQILLLFQQSFEVLPKLKNKKIFIEKTVRPAIAMLKAVIKVAITFYCFTDRHAIFFL